MKKKPAKMRLKKTVITLLGAPEKMNLQGGYGSRGGTCVTICNETCQGCPPPITTTGP